MADFTAETFEPLTGQTFTLLAFGGTDEDGNEHEPAQFPVTLEKVARSEPVCYPDTYERDEAGAVKTDADGKRIVAKKGEPVPDLPAPFALVFRAPDHTPVTDGAYTITHKDLGSLEGLSLSRELVTKPGKIRFDDNNKATEVDGDVLDHDTCLLCVQFS